MDFEDLNPKLEHAKVKLWTAADVVQHSFLVQNSISHLNLELCRSYEIRTSLKVPGYYPSFSFHKGVIDSEEKCRKVHSSRRYLFYTLHLDLPKRRERSLMAPSDLEKLSYDCEIPHLAKVYIGDEFYTEILCRLLDYTCRYTNHNEKVLKWFLKFGPFTKSVFRELPFYVIHQFMDNMYLVFSNLEFVEDCLKKLRFQIWADFSEKPGKIANLLHQVRFSGERLERWIHNSGFIHQCLLHPSFQYVAGVLKFLDAPYFCNRFRLLLEKRILDIKAELPLISSTKRSRNRRRITLLLHLYWTYINSTADRTAAASESLRLVWSSIRDPFITSTEIMTEFRENISLEMVSDIFNFYSIAIDDCRTSIDLRSLKHLCRSTIRRRLCENGHWLPDGVERTGLESDYQSYLNLEKIVLSNF